MDFRDACGVGFVADIKGTRSHAIVEQGLEILRRLSHRAATGADPDTGDGAGISIQLPEKFLRGEAERLGLELPPGRRFAVGNVFLPPDPAMRAACEQLIEGAVHDEGQRVVGWRDVPIDPSVAGPVARDVMPVFRQIFVRMRRVPPSAWERTLFVIRKLAENRVRERGADPIGYFHIASLSTETIIYKGLLLPARLGKFFLDLQRPEIESAVAVVHSRFSTNTFPTWDLAQPFRYIAHNGEINTLRGCRSSCRARATRRSSTTWSSC
jgi:glutamate synthase (NADPH/NADH) large chain